MMTKLWLQWSFTTALMQWNKRQRYERDEQKRIRIVFYEYLSNDDPEIRKRADAWRVGVGLQAVDGLHVSDYLLELARKNIEGELSIDEVKNS